MKNIIKLISFVFTILVIYTTNFSLAQNPFGKLNPDNPFSEVSSPFGKLNPDNPFSEVSSPFGKLNPDNPFSEVSSPFGKFNPNNPFSEGNLNDLLYGFDDDSEESDED